MYHKQENKSVLCQGDLFKDFNYIRWASFSGDHIFLDSVDIPFFVILIQACDLEQDYNDRGKSEDEKRDKYIHSILVCPAYVAGLVKEGKHLEKFDLITESYDKKRWNIIKMNKNPRYHFLEGDSTLEIPDLLIDFKQYYTIPTKILYELIKKHYLGSMNNLFKENLSHRFAFYLSRIGLPIIEKV